MAGLNPREFDGVSGASVGSGKSLKVTVELADALIDAYIELRVDSAVEDGRDNPAEARATDQGCPCSKLVKGRGYISALRIDM
ncbi:DUF2271 domain-containing protein [Massilia sp. B-10]|nr:DUF2271 domain-containing protein [Massilia sp. B-10]